jgi:hypothetical protein
MGEKRNCPWNAEANRRRCKGKTYVQMYGKEKARRLIEQRRKKARFSEKPIGYPQGISFAQFYGEERANEIKRRLSASLMRYHAQNEVV